MSFIDPYEVATCGQNLTNTFTLASNGILVDIFVIDLPDIEVPIEIGGGIIPGQEWPPEEKKVITRKKICVVATIDGKKYEQCIVVEDKPELKVDDIEVDVNTDEEKPKIKVSINL
jgi:hypothetical protein